MILSKSGNSSKSDIFLRDSKICMNPDKDTYIIRYLKKIDQNFPSTTSQCLLIHTPHPHSKWKHNQSWSMYVILFVAYFTETMQT